MRASSPLRRKGRLVAVARARALAFGRRRLFFFCSDRRADVLGLVDVERAVEMIHLVLETPPEQPLAFDFEAFAVSIERDADDSLVALEIADLSRHGEAAFVRLDLAVANRKARVDEDERPESVFFTLFGQIDDEQPLRDVDLRGGESDARRRVHRDEHIVDHLLDERVQELFRPHLLGSLVQGGVRFVEDPSKVRHAVHYIGLAKPPQSVHPLLVTIPARTFSRPRRRFKRGGAAWLTTFDGSNTTRSKSRMRWARARARWPPCATTILTSLQPGAIRPAPANPKCNSCPKTAPASWPRPKRPASRSGRRRRRSTSPAAIVPE